MKPSPDSKAIASLVLGILSLIFAIFSWFPVIVIVVLGTFGIGIVLAVIGLVLGIIANKKEKSGIGTTGIILSSISLGMYALFLVALVLLLIS